MDIAPCPISRRAARANAERLSAMPSVFVSVCGALIGDWAAVDRLAGEIGELVRAPAVVHTVE